MSTFILYSYIIRKQQTPKKNPQKKLPTNQKNL